MRSVDEHVITLKFHLGNGKRCKHAICKSDQAPQEARSGVLATVKIVLAAGGPKSAGPETATA
jgi:hypothetical protein